MTFPLKPTIIHVSAEDTESQQQRIERAVAALIPAAIAEGLGISVTRINATHFSVEVDPDVPCGITQERHI